MDGGIYDPGTHPRSWFGEQVHSILHAVTAWLEKVAYCLKDRPSVLCRLAPQLLLITAWRSSFVVRLHSSMLSLRLGLTSGFSALRPSWVLQRWDSCFEDTFSSYLKLNELSGILTLMLVLDELWVIGRPTQACVVSRLMHWELRNDERVCKMILVQVLP